MTHGGKRDGAGRPSVPIDEKRLIALRKQGISNREIGIRFGVPVYVIAYRMVKIKQSFTRTLPAL